MRMYHRVLAKAKRNLSIGNHNVEIDPKCNFRFFFYHGHNVCTVDDINKTFELDDCGYGGSISTKHCLAGYREYFTSIGYKQINPQPIYNYEYNNKK